jgi:hypothetical protein
VTWRARRRAVAHGIAIVVVAVLAGPAEAEPPAPVAYQAPVQAPVRDRFRPPASPYGPGNRGLEYATTPGQRVGAAAPGAVTFAGTVAGTRYVTVLHADRVRTTYGGLQAIAVAAGDEVGAGQPVGVAGDVVLWTARLATAYLDPAVLLGASGAPAVRLVAPPQDRAGARPPPVGRSRPPVPAAAAAWALALG